VRGKSAEPTGRRRDPVRDGARAAATAEDPDSGAPARLRGLRAGPSAGPEGGLLIASLRVRIPRDIWTGPFSTRHSGVRLEVLNRTDLTKDTSVSDYWIGGQPPGAWAEEIAAFPDVLRVESLAEVGDGCIYRVTYANPPVVYEYRRLGLPLQFPLKIQNGTMAWEVIGRRADTEEILRFAKRRDPGLRVLSVRRRGLRSHLPLLTPAQQQLLTDAMSAGYFAVPREITLTGLAEQLGRSKSALSEALAVIERKLLESALRPTTLLP
jgi:predicted DNA binding protein